MLCFCICNHPIVVDRSHTLRGRIICRDGSRMQGAVVTSCPECRRQLPDSLLRRERMPAAGPPANDEQPLALTSKETKP